MVTVTLAVIILSVLFLWVHPGSGLVHGPGPSQDVRGAGNYCLQACLRESTCSRAAGLPTEQRRGPSGAVGAVRPSGGLEAADVQSWGVSLPPHLGVRGRLPRFSGLCAQTEVPRRLRGPGQLHTLALPGLCDAGSPFLAMGPTVTHPVLRQGTISRCIRVSQRNRNHGMCTHMHTHTFIILVKTRAT